MLPGHLVICAGCLGLSTLNDEATRLSPPDTGSIDAETAREVAELQAQFRVRYAASGGLPPGFVWRTRPVCGRCLGEHGRGMNTTVPTDMLDGLAIGTCGVCGNSTALGITARMLVPRW